MIDIDKSDWILRVNKYPHPLHSNGYYSHQFNVLMLQGQRWMEELKKKPGIKGDYYTNLIGKYVYDKYYPNSPETLRYVFEFFSDDDRIRNDNNYVGIWIGFVCQYLCDDNKKAFKLSLNNILSKTFGDPLLHSKFGEGFENEIKGLKQFQYASYFLQYEGVDIHIGFDHRGSSIELDDSKSPEQCVEALKKFIDDLYKYK